MCFEVSVAHPFLVVHVAIVVYNCIHMAIQSSVGSSHVQNPFEAGANAYAEALKGLGVATPEFGFIFSSIAFVQEEVLKGVASLSGDLPMIGCSTAGEITTKDPLPDS